MEELLAIKPDLVVWRGSAANQFAVSFDECVSFFVLFYLFDSLSLDFAWQFLWDEAWYAYAYFNPIMRTRTVYLSFIFIFRFPALTWTSIVRKFSFFTPALQMFYFRAWVLQRIFMKCYTQWSTVSDMTNGSLNSAHWIARVTKKSLVCLKCALFQPILVENWSLYVYFIFSGIRWTSSSGSW